MIDIGQSSASQGSEATVLVDGNWGGKVCVCVRAVVC